MLLVYFSITHIHQICVFCDLLLQQHPTQFVKYRICNTVLCYRVIEPITFRINELLKK